MWQIKKFVKVIFWLKLSRNETMKNIHPTAIIHPKAEIGKNCIIGPFCQVDEDVKIGDNCYLQSNVLVTGKTTIGSGNRFFHSAVIGTQPQDLKYKGEATVLKIGDKNTFREFVTVNKSATTDEATNIGNHNLFMAYSHVAHNCQIGNNLIMANTVNLAGHIHIKDFVTIGGSTAVHQFVKIGSYAFVGGVSGVKKDIPPYTRGEGMPYEIKGLNSIGLRRKGFNKEQIAAIKKIYKLFYQSGLNVSQALKELDSWESLTNEQQIFADFINISDRGICK